MGYRSAKETAEAWGVTERLVQRLCSEGRIAGARKIGKSWAVPCESEKPDDLRKRSKPRPPANPAFPQEAFDVLPPLDLSAESAGALVAKPIRETDGARGAAPQEIGMLSAHALSRLMPLMNSSFEPGTCIEVVKGFEDPKIRAIAKAEYCYFSGDPEGSCRAIGDLIYDDDLAIRLSACLLYAYANLPLGNINRTKYALTELGDALAKSSSTPSPRTQAAMAFVGYVSSVLLHIPLPKDAPSINELLPLLPPGVREFALYVYAHLLYLNGDYARSLGIAEATLLSTSKTFPIPEIYLHMVAVMDCMSLKYADDARTHLLAAWDLARPDGLIEAFGEHHGLLGGMLESVIKKNWPDDFKRIIDITYRFSAGWRRIHNPATEETVADNLTTTEFSVSMLAARGWTNQEIGKHLGISASTVKGYLAASFRKLGISKRQELGKFMLK